MSSPSYEVTRIIDISDSIFLMAFTTSLQAQVVATISVFATSSFGEHSLISTVTVVQQVVNGKIPKSLRLFYVNSDQR